jgi:flavin reductase (DIM6/NTAB) family NADH-FMN oxidoreductase RutF
MADGDDLRALMRRFPAGVAVVTVDTGTMREGLTVGSLVSLSLEPPLVGFSIARQSPMHELLRTTPAFAVSLLAAEQDSLARHFARGGMPPLVRFHGVDVRSGTLGAPLIERATGWLECRIAQEVDVSTHTFFVAAVERAEPGPGVGALVYIDGLYRAL